MYYALPQLGIVLGAKKHHLEIAAGPMFYQSHYGDEYTPVSGSLGYRFQKPQGNFQFRLGAAWPEGIISSTLGVAF